ncbi:type II toxin-antitoxin system PemK/MazF family toxin [Micromonospora sp. PLK6-60]|uniref:type II toxin-antitoxin system PemK/MazF family toxin n=1 Tax=Micromonospora sp. PLK6-60 TaxID=2873383 RepID=UPI001CA6E272|nr:type II toxin-antitoxin system PemK/MazF family toxin [Micromonospora sp. PLK6-60]MBY8870825.1 type II toxin-antitoxin system PemK/MazF family toxin [Micromonospora sp. PLK6-60]
MPEWLWWGLLIVLAVAAGWAWNEWRRPGGRGPRTGAERDRPARDRSRPTAPPRPRAPAGTPRSGEIWWADVPYADGSGSKVRPCLVLRAGTGDAEVLKITSQDKSGRDDHVRIPTRDWDPGAEHDSWLDLAEPLPVPLTAFEKRAGSCEPHLWRQVRRLHARRSPA